jgi:two-component system chemotaxis response regulator CheY
MMRAIVVDDSKTMRTLLKGVLRDAGVEVVAEAENGREALSVLSRTGPVELMLLDWNMPVMNGFELLVEIRRDDKLSRMRMMMVTTETEASQILRALEAGADEYLIKPFSRQAIREKLELMGLFE